jgi:hypothetical protein
MFGVTFTAVMGVPMLDTDGPWHTKDEWDAYVRRRDVERAETRELLRRDREKRGRKGFWIEKHPARPLEPQAAETIDHAAVQARVDAAMAAHDATLHELAKCWGLTFDEYLKQYHQGSLAIGRASLIRAVAEQRGGTA